MSEKKIHVELAPDEAQALAGLVGFAVEKGGPLESMAAHTISKVMQKAILAALSPEDRKGLVEQIDELREEVGDEVPEELEEVLDRLREQLTNPLTESEIENVDMDELTKALRQVKDLPSV